MYHPFDLAGEKMHLLPSLRQKRKLKNRFLSRYVRPPLPPNLPHKQTSAKHFKIHQVRHLSTIFWLMGKKSQFISRDFFFYFFLLDHHCCKAQVILGAYRELAENSGPKSPALVKGTETAVSQHLASDS